jgi:hypothetical protein
LSQHSAAIADSPTGRQIDILGVCDDGSCQICNARASPAPGRFTGCAAGAGLANAKTCTVGGTIYATHDAPWAPSNYYEDPVAVWLAIFFPFIVLLFVIQFLTCQRVGL